MEVIENNRPIRQIRVIPDVFTALYTENFANVRLAGVMESEEVMKPSKLFLKAKLTESQKKIAERVSYNEQYKNKLFQAGNNRILIEAVDAKNSSVTIFDMNTFESLKRFLNDHKLYYYPPGMPVPLLTPTANGNEYSQLSLLKTKEGLSDTQKGSYFVRDTINTSRAIYFNTDGIVPFFDEKARYTDNIFKALLFGYYDPINNASFDDGLKIIAKKIEPTKAMTDLGQEIMAREMVIVGPEAIYKIYVKKTGFETKLLPLTIKKEKEQLIKPEPLLSLEELDRQTDEFYESFTKDLRNSLFKNFRMIKEAGGKKKMPKRGGKRVLSHEMVKQTLKLHKQVKESTTIFMGTINEKVVNENLVKAKSGIRLIGEYLKGIQKYLETYDKEFVELLKTFDMSGDESEKKKEAYRYMRNSMVGGLLKVYANPDRILKNTTRFNEIMIEMAEIVIPKIDKYLREFFGKEQNKIKMAIVILDRFTEIINNMRALVEPLHAFTELLPK